ncbi:MAG: recombinase RecT [Bacillota bacterium]
MAENTNPNNELEKAPSRQQEVIERFNFFNPEHFATMQRVATLFATSELVPDMYRITDKNPKEKAIANCIIAIDMAQRIGANVLMVMQNLVIVYGRPSWSSKFLISTVNTCGRYEPLQYKFEDLGELSNVEYTEYEWNGQKKVAATKVLKDTIRNISCYAYTSSKGTGKILEGAPISIEMAIKEGWYTKNGSKWKTMPKQMLMYRAASFWTNAYAPDLSMGMKTEDEIKDIEEAQIIEENEIDKNANKDIIDIKPKTESQGENTQPAANTEVKQTEEKSEKKQSDKQQSDKQQDTKKNSTKNNVDLGFAGPGF